MSAPIFSIEDVTIPPVQIKEYHLIFSIKSIIPELVLVVRDPYLPQKIRLGSTITVKYMTTTQPITAVKTYLFYVNSFQLTSATQDPTIFDTVVVKGLADWSRHLPLETKGYYGSVSTILSTAARSIPSFPATEIDTSSDSPRIRYQLKEQFTETLNRIKKYAIDQLNPMVLFMGQDNKIKLKSIKSFRNQAVGFRLVPISPLADPKSTYSSMSVAGGTAVECWQLAVDGNVPDRAQSYDTYFQTASMVPSQQTNAPEKNVTEAQLRSDLLLPRKSLFYDWTTSPQESLAISINEVFELTEESRTVVALTNNSIDLNIDLGSVVELLSTTKSLTDIKYYVRYIDHFIMDGKNMTKLYMVGFK